MRRGRTHDVRAALFLVVMLAPAPAFACWDGYSATLGRVTVQSRSTDVWSPALAHDVANWLARIDALLPSSGFTVDEPDVDDLPTLFERTADLLRLSPTVRATAMAKTHEVYTVQVFASKTASGAASFASVLNAANVGEEGFLSVGGFPALHELAHVVSSGSVHRVFVGAFLDASRAYAARAAIARSSGVVGFVRLL